MKLDNSVAAVVTGAASGLGEATARALFVHPNTVRYRLKRISEIIGWDATGAREALALHTAIILGSVHDATRERSQRQAPRHAPRGKDSVGG